MPIDAYGSDIPDDAEFKDWRRKRRRELEDDLMLRKVALEFQDAADKRSYVYLRSWLGVPIIRLPDDICVMQELIFELKPAVVVETGTARGGSLILSASLQELAGVTPNVLGIDIALLPHTEEALELSRYREQIVTWEGDSASRECRKVVSAHLEKYSENRPCLLVLDSNHSHAHVLAELQMLATLLPVGSTVAVADTIINELPDKTYRNRPWGPSANPMTALTEFLSANEDFIPADDWNCRALVSEFRNGYIVRTG